jgi:hypothetical protein
VSGALLAAGTERDRAAWDALVPPGSGSLREGFLAAWEQAELAGLRPRRLTARGVDGDLLAGAPAYLYDLDLTTVRAPLAPRLVGALRRLWPRLLVARVLELGSPCAAVDPLLLAPGAAPREAARRVVERALEQAERDRAHMVVVQDVVGPELAEALAAAGFAQVGAPPTVVLTLRHAGFEEYLAAMRHKYRRRARCVLRDSAHLQAQRLTEFDELADEFARLWRLVYERATETRREVCGPAFFRAVSRLPETSAIVLRRDDGSLAAFGLLLEDRPWLHFLQCGFRADAGREEAAYFRLTFEIVRHGIESGFGSVNLGCTTLGPKLDLGGEPVALCAWIRHRNPLVQRVFAAGARRWAQPPRVAARRVFAQAG